HYRQPLNCILQRLSSARRTLTRGYHVLAAARDTRVDTAVEPDEAVLPALREVDGRQVACHRAEEVGDGNA
ncbi:hypothetical protein PPH41_44165, partial [Burkholderia gladioli]|nr:hypothetical protein [Burkholderia gladioli]